MTLWIENLRRLVALVETNLATARSDTADVSFETHSDWLKRHRAAEERLLMYFTEVHDARFTARGAHDHTVKMAGIRSTSTGGWTGALQNWKTAALKKIETAEGADDPINLQGSGPAPIEAREG